MREGSRRDMQETQANRLRVIMASFRPFIGSEIRSLFDFI